MRKIKYCLFPLWIVLAISLVCSCKPSVPGEYIQPNKMADILYDYHLSDAMADANGSKPYVKIAYREAVLKKYDVTQADFDSSMVYYMRHTERMRDIYEKVADHLTKEATAQGFSAEDVNRFGNTAKGDTANIWTEEKAIIFNPYVPFNYRTFYVKADTSFHARDHIMLDFSTQFLYQDGIRDAIAVLAVKFKNDSVATQMVSLTNSSHYSIDIPDQDSLGIKEVRGFFLLKKGNDQLSPTTDNSIKMMLIYGIRLIRMRGKATPNATLNPSMPQGGQRPDSMNSHPMPQPAANTPVSGGAAPVPPPIRNQMRPQRPNM
jgi:hypothetical protein